MPGVVLLDQVVAAIEAVHGVLPALRLPQVKFVQPLLPGEDAEVAFDALPGARWKFRVLRGDVLLASGEVVAA